MRILVSVRRALQRDISWIIDDFNLRSQTGRVYPVDVRLTARALSAEGERLDLIFGLRPTAG